MSTIARTPLERARQRRAQPGYEAGAAIARKQAEPLSAPAPKPKLGPGKILTSDEFDRALDEYIEGSAPHKWRPAEDRLRADRAALIARARRLQREIDGD